MLKGYFPAAAGLSRSWFRSEILQRIWHLSKGPDLRLALFGSHPFFKVVLLPCKPHLAIIQGEVNIIALEIMSRKTKTYYLNPIQRVLGI